ncbi:hypothetical protein N0V91_008394 [Didymella pomorum]|uniref:Alkylmercury lyase n=1 Tax=Didymella pomorum TaxID=749634 RepID=A0A9W8Z934_9PLEO|nr:hypothetical protein N0V91_008394 [Didymella pomorum]
MPTVTTFQEQVRGILTQQIAQRGQAPSNDELASLLSCTREEVDEALLALHSTHSLLLHPNSNKTEPWVVHPFSLYPSSCWVQTGSLGYWATCLYCGMGIAAALNADADIFTRFGGESEQCIVRVRDQDVLEEDLVFHLSTPIKEWWDNVIYACASFQPFRNEDEVDDWCRRHNMKKGAVVPLPKMWRFASAWYGDYVSKPWHKRSKEEVGQVLEDNELTTDFWSIE